MAAIWTEQEKLNIWLEIELLAIEARAELGEIPRQAAIQARKKAGFTVEEVLAKEEITKHDIAAFVDVVGARLGGLAKYIHIGMTSSDLLDTTFSLQLLKASDILLKDLDRLLAALKGKAMEHKYTPMIGRTHGIHAEPITFGLVLTRFYDEFSRAKERLQAAREEIRVGKLSGAVGDYFHLDPKIEEFVMKKLGLKPASVSSQIVSRDRYGFYFQVLALVATSIEHLALQVRHFQRTEVLEAEEYFLSRPERQFGHASQAQPRAFGKPVRAGADYARVCAGRAGKCPALARAGHQPFFRGKSDRPGRDRVPRFHDQPDGGDH